MWEHPAYLFYFIASFCFLPCPRRWQMPAQGLPLRKIFTSLLCSVFKWFFPGSGGGGGEYSIFQSLPEKVFQNWIFYQKGRKGERKFKQGTYTRRVALKNLNDIISLQTRKWPNSLFSTHYFSSLFCFAILTAFGSGSPVPSLLVYTLTLYHLLQPLLLTLEGLTWPQRSVFFEGVSPKQESW